MKASQHPERKRQIEQLARLLGGRDPFQEILWGFRAKSVMYNPMHMPRSLTFLLLATLLLVGSCLATGQRIPQRSTDYEFTVERPKDQVFDGLLSVAQSLNLSVEVLEKQSGFVQYKNAALSPFDLDKYCMFPAVKPGTTQGLGHVRQVE
jgi:hypothetical protein